MLLKYIKSKLALSDEEMARISRAREIRKKYPSIRVVGRGTVVINPQDIVDSDSFKSDLARVESIVKA